MKLRPFYFMCGVAFGLGVAFAVAVAADQEVPTVIVPVRVALARFQECQSVGGCGFVTKAELSEVYESGRTVGRSEAFETLDFHGCRPDRS